MIILDVFVPIVRGPPNQCQYLLLFPPGNIGLIENKHFSTIWLNWGYKRKGVSYTEMAKIQTLFLNLEIHFQWEA